MKPLQQLGIKEEDLIKEDTSNCRPKYYEDGKSEPVTFRFPVVVKVWISIYVHKSKLVGQVV